MIRDLVHLQERMNRLFDEAFPGTSKTRPEGEEFFSGMWSPAVDIYEDEHATTIKADVPGIDPESLDVRVEDNRLIIRGERKMENEVKRENFRQVERSYGSFVRMFALPPHIKSDQIEAHYKNGELRLILPRREEARSKQIKITSGEAEGRRIGKNETGPQGMRTTSTQEQPVEVGAGHSSERRR